MSGAPVTLVEAGGAPVTPVHDGGAFLTPVDAGGAPVTLADDAAPVVIEGWFPKVLVRPFITGDFIEGEELTCVTGEWWGEPTFAYQWLRDGEPIEGATSSTYTLTAADVDTVVSCLVTGTNDNGSSTAAAPGEVVAPIADALAAMLAALEAAGKLMSAWYLPLGDPTRDLTLNGSAVEGWAAAYGTQKVNLAEATNPPAWDSSLFGGKGGVVFNGTTTHLSAAGGNVANWPGTNDTLFMLAAVRQDRAAGTAGTLAALAYGSTGADFRAIRRAVISAANRGSAGLPTISDGAVDFSGAHTLGGRWTDGATTRPYVDGATAATGSSTPSTLTLTRARMGANAAGTLSGWWDGVIACAAVLGPTATEGDFLALEAVMRGRIS